jgi:hypothetical protein
VVGNVILNHKFKLFYHNIFNVFVNVLYFLENGKSARKNGIGRNLRGFVAQEIGREKGQVLGLLGSITRESV